jgi:hypothetical protein
LSEIILTTPASRIAVIVLPAGSPSTTMIWEVLSRSLARIWSMTSFILPASFKTGRIIETSGFWLVKVSVLPIE